MLALNTVSKTNRAHVIFTFEKRVGLFPASLLNNSKKSVKSIVFILLDF